MICLSFHPTDISIVFFLHIIKLKFFYKFKIVSQVYCEVENLNRVFKFLIEIFFRNGDRRIIGDRYDADDNQKYSIPADT